ncbi:MAG: GDP-mannose 4,6-dehydratase [Candidatus Thermoplasmatota archaeon]|nr:GDP-mannose 4,6-dehydratase [Candidatus Thermoplasmatota archaeon]
MRILITGADGFIGSRLHRTLSSSKHDVLGLGLREGQCVDIRGSILDRDWLKGVLKEISPDLVYHFAAISSVGLSFREPRLTYDVNVNGTLNLLGPLEEGTRVVFSGSSEEYGEPLVSLDQFEEMRVDLGHITEPSRLPEIPSREGDPLRPMSPYATSKVMGEYLVLGYPGIDGVCARSYNVEGPGRGPDFVTSRIADHVKGCVLSNSDMDVGNIFNFRDWSHVDDIVRYYIALGEKGIPGKVYNIGSGRSMSILSFLLHCFDHFGVRINRIKGNRIRMDDPMEISKSDILGDRSEHYIIDDFLVKNNLNYLKGSTFKFISDDAEYRFNLRSDFFRDRDIRLQAGDMSRIRELAGFCEKGIKEIVNDIMS